MTDYKFSKSLSQIIDDNRNIDEFGLQKPTPIAHDYKLNISSNASIKAVGYGTDHRDHPLRLMEFERRVPRSDDVVIQILFCGVCHSDWHVILNEWKNSKYPILVGHEVTGRIVRIGSKVTKFKIGDLAAIGPNYNSCRQCKQCKIGFEQYCLNDVTEIYNMPDRFPGQLKPTGAITYGGYSNVITANEFYVIKLPDFAIEYLPKISPILCAGATVYTPLKYMGINGKSKVGIIGIGGLGHMGIKLAVSFGAKVVAITHTPDKLEKAISLGANQAVLSNDTDSLKKLESSFDLIINTIPFNHDLMPYINLIKPNGTLWIVGSFFTMATDFDLINRKGRIIRGSSTAGIADTQEVVDYCMNNGIYPDIEIIKIADINDTHQNLMQSKVHYRYVIDMDSIYS